MKPRHPLKRREEKKDRMRKVRRDVREGKRFEERESER